jgi:hypothetical protein
MLVSQVLVAGRLKRKLSEKLKVWLVCELIPINEVSHGSYIFCYYGYGTNTGVAVQGYSLHHAPHVVLRSMKTGLKL